MLKSTFKEEKKSINSIQVNNHHLNSWKYPINLEINIKGCSRFNKQPSYAMFCSKSFTSTPHFNQVRYSYPRFAK